MHRSAIVLCSLALSTLSASSAAAQCMYEFVPVYVPGPGSDAMYLRTIANNGWAGGDTAFGDRPLLVSPDGNVTLLGGPQIFGSVEAIAGDGTIYGEFRTARGPNVPSVWVSGGPQPLPIALPVSNGYVNDINDHGWVSGFIDAFPLEIAGPCVWTPNGTVPVYEVIGGIGYGIDNSGRLYGWTTHPDTWAFRGYSYLDGRVQWLPLPEGMSESSVSGASPVGHACGSTWATEHTQSQATVWRDNIPTVLELPLGYTRTNANNVNSLGQAIGWASSVSGGPLPEQPMLWIEGSASFLFTLFESPFVGGVTSVSCINERGEICGSGYDANGNACGVILRPIRTRIGDATLDCRVDIRDLNALFEFWGRTYDYDGGPGDLDADGSVGAKDLALVLGDWGSQ